MGSMDENLRRSIALGKLNSGSGDVKYQDSSPGEGYVYAGPKDYSFQTADPKSGSSTYNNTTGMWKLAPPAAAPSPAAAPPGPPPPQPAVAPAPAPAAAASAPAAPVADWQLQASRGSGLVGQNGEGSWIAGMAGALQPYARQKLEQGTYLLNDMLSKGEAMVGRATDAAYQKVADTAAQFTPDTLNNFMLQQPGQVTAALGGSGQYQEAQNAWEEEQKSKSSNQWSSDKDDEDKSPSELYRQATMQNLSRGRA